MSTFDEFIQTQDKFWFCCRCRADRLSRILSIISLCFSALFIALSVLMIFVAIGFGIATIVEEEEKAGKGNHASSTTISPFLVENSDESSGKTDISGGGNIASYLLYIIANVLILVGYSRRQSGYYIPALVLEGITLAIFGFFTVISMLLIFGFIFFLPIFMLMFFFFWVDFRAYQLIKLEEEWRQNHGPQSAGPVGYAPNSYAVTMTPPAYAQNNAQSNVSQQNELLPAKY